MKTFSLLPLLAVSFALFTTACGNGGNPDTTVTFAPNASHPSAPTAPNTPDNREHADACNSNPGCAISGHGGSCTLGSATCIDYNGGNVQGLAEFRAACEKNHGQGSGQYSAGLCPTANILGNCKTEGGTPAESVIHFYNAPGMTTGIVQGACTPANGNCAVYCAP
jgi:hypothetical protein